MTPEMWCSYYQKAEGGLTVSGLQGEALAQAVAKELNTTISPCGGGRQPLFSEQARCEKYYCIDVGTKQCLEWDGCAVREPFTGDTGGLDYEAFDNSLHTYTDRGKPDAFDWASMRKWCGLKTAFYNNVGLDLEMPRPELGNVPLMGMGECPNTQQYHCIDGLTGSCVEMHGSAYDTRFPEMPNYGWSSAHGFGGLSSASRAHGARTLGCLFDRVRARACAALSSPARRRH